MSENLNNINSNSENDNTAPENTAASNTAPEPVNTDAASNKAAEGADGSQPVYTPPVTPPGGAYNAPPYGTQYSRPDNSYQPYGAPFTPPRPEAPKKPSKNKKKGLIITGIILCALFLTAIAVLVVSLVFGDESNSPQDGTDTQGGANMNLADAPEGDEGTQTADGKLTSSAVYEKVHKSSVGVLIYTNNQQKLYTEGTGIIVEIDGAQSGTYIVTCAHVIDAANARVVVQLYDGTQYDASIVGYDSKTDIGLIRIAESGLPAAQFASSDSLKVGDTVYAIGNPGGTQFFGSFTNGMVSAIGRPVDSPVGYEVECIQHTAPINPGNSGGALVNEYGQVVGINSSKIASTEYEGMGFSVPSVTVKEIVDELIKNGRVTNRPALGITYMPASNSRTHSIILKSNQLPAGAIIIDSINASSDLNDKDVKEGDMIIAVNGEELENHETLLNVIENGKVGDTVTLTIGRIDANYQVSTFDITVKLVEDTGAVPKEEVTENSFQFPFGQ